MQMMMIFHQKKTQVPTWETEMIWQNSHFSKKLPH